MMLYISIIFHEHILNAYQLLQRKQNYYCQSSKGNNSKEIYRQKLQVFLWSDHHPMMFYISVKFHIKSILEGVLLSQRQQNYIVKFQRRITLKYKDKSYGSCCLHVV